MSSACGCPQSYPSASMAASCGGGQYLLFMGLLQQIIVKQCDISDPCGRVWPRSETEEDYDFVIIGGGTAGAAVAARLAEVEHWKVLLLEAGGEEPPAASVPSFHRAFVGNPEADWMYRTEPETKACLAELDQRCSWPRAKLLGGTSVINGMTYMRGYAEDYNGWVESGAEGWSYDEVLPYFLKSEDNLEIGTLVSADYHSTGGPVPVQRFPYQQPFLYDIISAALELGYNFTDDPNGEYNRGFAIPQTASAYGERMSAARSYLGMAADRENLHLSLFSEATRIIFKENTTEIEAVEFLKFGELYTVRVNKEVILSAGTLNTPIVLLNSGVGPSEVLEANNIPVIMDLPGVGQNLANHIGVNLMFTIDRPFVRALDLASAGQYLLFRDGPMSSTGVTQLTAYLNSMYATDEQPDIQVFFYGYDADCSMSGSGGEPVDLDSPHKKMEIGVSAVILRPHSRGNVTLAPLTFIEVDDNSTGLTISQWQFHSGYFTDDRDVLTLLEAIDMVMELTNTTALGENFNFRLKPSYAPNCLAADDFTITEEKARCLIAHYTDPQNHQVGTSRMGTDQLAVVSPRLDVHGLKGVRVIDASVMPAVPSGNPMAAVYMVAERGSDFIKEDHGKISAA